MWKICRRCSEVKRIDADEPAYEGCDPATLAMSGNSQERAGLLWITNATRERQTSCFYTGNVRTHGCRNYGADCIRRGSAAPSLLRQILSAVILKRCTVRRLENFLIFDRLFGKPSKA